MSKYYSDNQLPHKTMTLTGQGQVAPVPNTAVIRLGVQTQGDNLTSIQSENARITQGVIQSLQRIGVTDIKTFQYSIDKIYDYENGTQIDKGYSVRNILEINTNNIDQAGNIIDTAVNNGANMVELITFDVTDREYYYQQALNLAVVNAIQKARSISMNMGVKMDPIPISIVENSIFPIPLQQYQREFVSTPIIPGNIMIEAAVTVEFLY